jgi:hypothetical protein
MTTGKCSCGFAFGRGDLLSAFLAVLVHLRDEKKETTHVITIKDKQTEYTITKIVKKSHHVTALNSPPKPEELVGALQDSIHETKGKLLGTTPIRREKND